MENVLRIIYNKSIVSHIINLDDIDNILSYIVTDKYLNDHIKSIEFQGIRSNNLASYSIYDKSITLYLGSIHEMTDNINNNLLDCSNFERVLYINLMILQIILHEVEHANQYKNMYSNNSLEMFIIRISHMIRTNNEEPKIYEFNPEERMAEISSLKEIIYLTEYIQKKLNDLPQILSFEKCKRELRGYHYREKNIKSPLMEYFLINNRNDLINVFNFIKNMNLEERLYYGLNIDSIEYCKKLKYIIDNNNKYFTKKLKL